ncbi:hypothetical protein FBUS_06806 [Fasciolopsis buskii]|uniref:Uncharacterized protein n=1 Tax=Fasciolopsis buskii TaxID=27845 RepID=A0A8E0VNC7_9TREM|nr:hypothetical protein FBUS_06806 [Fasciolopsis buski]
MFNFEPENLVDEWGQESDTSAFAGRNESPQMLQTETKRIALKRPVETHVVRTMPKSRFIIPLVLQFLMAWLSCIHCTCPTDFIEVSYEICMLVLKLQGNYCQAHERCEAEGRARGLRLFLPGRNAALICTVAPAQSLVYTGVSAFLNRSTNLREGWRYSDPGWAWYSTTANDKDVPWDAGCPNELHGSIMSILDYHIRDDFQLLGTTTHAVCELSSIIDTGLGEQFKKDWPYPMSSLFFPCHDAIGCFTFSTENTLLRCGYGCKLRSACRSFYFNTATGQCGLSLYVDSLLPSNMSILRNAVNWVRFGRPDA